MLTREENEAIAALHQLAARWPESLWLYSASGSLHVMKKGPDGKQVVNQEGGFDCGQLLATIDIENDGGDW